MGAWNKSDEHENIKTPICVSALWKESRETSSDVDIYTIGIEYWD